MRAPAGELPFVSIIVPVFNGEKLIKQCLDSLFRQTYPRNKYEVIVVDNNSADQGVIIARRFENVIVCHESKQGSYAARNTGLKAARGNIIAFIDVDCIATDNWLEQAVLFISSNGEPGIIAGKVEFFSNQPFSVWGFFDRNSFLNQEYSAEAGIAKTANMLTFFSLFEKVGLFDDDLRSGGDVDWTAKAVASGYSLFYCPEAVVLHPVRNSFREVAKKCYRVGLGKGQVQRKKKRRGKAAGAALNSGHFRHPFRLFRQSLSKEEKSRGILFPLKCACAITVLAVMFGAGMARGFLFAFREKEVCL